MEGNDPSPLLSTCETTPGVPCPVLGSPVQDRREHIEHSSTKGPEKDGEAGVSLGCQKVETLSSLKQRRLRGSLSVYINA